jgi:chromosome segregation ATPase
VAVVVGVAMASEGERQVTGPSGPLAQRVGDHVGSADLLLRQSHAAVERVRARVRQTHRRVERTSRRVEEAAGGVRAVQRSTAGAVERFLQIKQRELAAHLAAEALHARAAELQERMGHPERAAEARRQAEQARAWYRLAGEELDDYQAAIRRLVEPAWPGPSR